jgi:signal transduction histidine kinase
MLTRDTFTARSLVLQAGGYGPETRTVEHPTESSTEQTLEESLALATHRLREQDAELLRLKQEQARFHSAMTHELRTPLNSVLILSELLIEEASLAPRERGYARNIRNAISDVLDLLGQVLELVKLEARAVEPLPAATSLRDLIDELEQDLQRRAAEAGAALTIELADGLPAEARLDGDRLEATLSRLLDFLLASRTKRRIDVRLQQRSGADPDGARMLAIEIHDPAFAVPAAGPEALFEPFRSADTQTRRAFGGIGLTLSICRQSARLLGGELSVSAAPRRGAVFLLQLPALPPAAGSDRAGSQKR